MAKDGLDRDIVKTEIIKRVKPIADDNRVSRIMKLNELISTKTMDKQINSNSIYTHKYFKYKYKYEYTII